MQSSSPTGSADSDNQRKLIEEARAGSREALGQLLEPFRPHLLQTAYAQLAADLQSTAGGSDLVQQTFQEARQHYHRFEGTTEAELVAWLRHILDRNVADFRREFRGTDNWQVLREVPPDGADCDAGQLGGLASRDPSAGSRVSAREQTQAVEQALTRLPEVDRQLIDLHNRQHLSFAEIALVIDRSPEAVRRLWTHAIEKLQRELGSST